MKVGISVYCLVCRQRKCPRGRSAPMGSYLCSWDCEGYTQEPHVGILWPGETEEDFGYPVSSDVGTKEVSQ
jgi:hypothetical protein